VSNASPVWLNEEEILSWNMKKNGNRSCLFLLIFYNLGWVSRSRMNGLLVGDIA
jgi:hypothetical protein